MAKMNMLFWLSVEICSYRGRILFIYSSYIIANSNCSYYTLYWDAMNFLRFFIGSCDLNLKVSRTHFFEVSKGTQ